jgi:hypothetical protein
MFAEFCFHAASVLMLIPISFGLARVNKHPDKHKIGIAALYVATLLTALWM